MPTKGCSRDAVSCTLRVINPICLKSRRYASFRIGYTAGLTGCRRSFKKWQKPMAAKTPNAVVFIPPFRDPFNYNFDPLVPLGIEMVGTAMHSRLVAEGKGGSAMRSEIGRA